MPSNKFIASRCTDLAFIKAVYFTLKPTICTDQFPGIPELEELSKSDNVMFVQVGEEGKAPEGLAAFYGQEVHTLFLPSLRGARALKAARAVLAWVWENTKFPAITSFVYSNRPDVAVFARLMGFEFTGSYSDGTTINGVPVTTNTLALLRPCPLPLQ